MIYIPYSSACRKSCLRNQHKAVGTPLPPLPFPFLSPSPQLGTHTQRVRVRVKGRAHTIMSAYNPHPFSYIADLARTDAALGMRYLPTWTTPIELDTRYHAQALMHTI